MTELEFYKEIYEKTGKKLGEYGFIAGTMHPMFTPTGFTSSGEIDGFEVWKKGGKSKVLKPKNVEESLKQIIKFLNQK